MIDAFVEHARMNLELREKMEPNKYQKKTSGDQNKTIDVNVSLQTSFKKSIKARFKSPDLNDSLGNTNTTLQNISSFSVLRNDNSFTSELDNSSINSIFKRKRKREEACEPKVPFENLETGSDSKSTRGETSENKPNLLQPERKTETKREFKINMTRTDLDRFINESKTSNTNLNTFLQDKLNSSFVTKPSEITNELVRSKMHVHYCSNYYEIIALLMNAESALKRNKNAFKLIVVDNVTFLFHTEDGSNYLKRTKNVYFLLNMLSNLATTYNLAVVLVNQLTTKYINSHQPSNSKRKVVPALGETFAHRIQTRLFLQKFNLGLLSLLGEESSQVIDDTDSMFMCLVDKMNVHSEEMRNKKHVLFQINEHGIRDV